MKRAWTPKERRQRRRRREARQGPNHHINASERTGHRRGDGDRNRKPKWKRQYRRAVKEFKKDKRKELRKREKDPYKKGTKAKPGKKAPFVKPFMNADDLMEYGQAHGTFADTLNQLDFALENKRIEGQYEKSELSKAAIASSADASNEMASRGLFHSSVRDGELYDINATSALRQNYLDRQLDTATIQTQTQKVAAQNAWDDFQRGMNQKKVQNAQEIMANTPKWLVDPTKATGPSGYKPKPLGNRPRKRDFRPNRPPGHHINPSRRRPGYQQGGGGAGPGGPGGRGGGHNRPNRNGTGGTGVPGHGN